LRCFTPLVCTTLQPLPPQTIEASRTSASELVAAVVEAMDAPAARLAKFAHAYLLEFSVVESGATRPLSTPSLARSSDAPKPADGFAGKDESARKELATVSD
jgi:hypothetical protein